MSYDFFKQSRLHIFLLFTVMLLGLTGFGAEKKAKYVFMFIGDGMGPLQVQAAQEAADWSLCMLAMPVQGFQHTGREDGRVTDSAASGTALACGVKTSNGFLGMTSEKKGIESIADKAKNKGMRVGILSNVSLDHATPASYYAHVPSRQQYDDITDQMAASKIDFFGGGGLSSDRGNGRYKGKAFDVIANAGFTIVTKPEDIQALEPGTRRVYATSPTLRGAALPYEIDSHPEELPLHTYTATAIRLLDNPDGFFIMVEGGKIDWACHANDLGAAIRDIHAFDKAIAEAVKFQQAHPDETLIVITADHETGGLKRLEAENADPKVLMRQITTCESFKHHLKKLPLTPQSSKDMLKLVEDMYGLTELSDIERQALMEAWQAMLSDPLAGPPGFRKIESA